MVRSLKHLGETRCALLILMWRSPAFKWMAQRFRENTDRSATFLRRRVETVELFQSPPPGVRGHIILRSSYCRTAETEGACRSVAVGLHIVDYLI
jgi:hypothetical protein